LSDKHSRWAICTSATMKKPSEACSVTTACLPEARLIEPPLFCFHGHGGTERHDEIHIIPARWSDGQLER
jgi:hypothetical protein